MSSIILLLVASQFSSSTQFSMFQRYKEEIGPSTMRAAKSFIGFLIPDILRDMNKTTFPEKVNLIHTNATFVEVKSDRSNGIDAQANITNINVTGTWKLGYGWLTTGGVLDAAFNNLSIETILQVSMQPNHAAVAIEYCKAKVGKPTLRFNNGWLSIIFNQFAEQIENSVHEAMGNILCEVIKAVAGLATK